MHDFLFEYYTLRPNALRTWHPGFGIALGDAEEYGRLRGYRVEDGIATVTEEERARLLPLVENIRTLLAATLSRPANLACFGLHEWAMVYRTDQPRHPWPLRLGGPGTDAVVEEHRIGCSHFDAYRFFTPAARPRNELNPGRDDRAAFEQPGCLHAGMDLYKHAFRLGPLIDSTVVADAFELAWDIRILDMRAAPYEFTGLTLDPAGEEWSPIAIETPEGKAEYARHQRAFSERAAPIRRSLIDWCDRLLAGVAGTSGDGGTDRCHR